MSFLVEKFIESNKKLLINVSSEIWSHPELCFEEKFAHDLLTETLENCGFHVQRQYFLPTAFRAEFDSGKEGPVIAAVCEYDALPGIGHACGHNLIAEIGLGVGIAVKKAMEENSSIKGKIVVLGTPAEEGGGGKIKLIQKGAFNDIDAAMMAHPQSANRLYPLIVESAAMAVTFKAHPEEFWLGPSAVDAAVACYNNITLMRRTLSEKQRISMIIPSSSSEESRMELLYRAQTSRELRILKEKLEVCIKTAAQVANCEFKVMSDEERDSSYKGLLYNKTMTEVFGKHAISMGVAFYDNDPRFVESAVSSDIGNVSHVVPAMQPEFEIGAEPFHVNHTPGFAEVARSKKAQEHTFVIIKALAKTAIDLLSNPDLMARVKDEFKNNPFKEP